MLLQLLDATATTACLHATAAHSVRACASAGATFVMRGKGMALTLSRTSWGVSFWLIPWVSDTCDYGLRFGVMLYLTPGSVTCSAAVLNGGCWAGRHCAFAQPNFLCVLQDCIATYSARAKGGEPEHLWT